jgi:P-type Cu+ transporter
MRTLVATAIAFIALSTTAFAGPTPSTAKAAPLICPVTGETIPSIADAAGHSVYKGKTYYFCCSGCKPMFDKDPAAYVKTTSTKITKKPTVAPKSS